MLKNLTKIIVSLCLALLFSCNSKLSTGKVEAIALIGARIEITQNPTDKNQNGIIVYLFDDDGNSIENDSLKIIVNGIEGELLHYEQLYYTEVTYYDFMNVPVKDNYIVEIKLTNQKKYVLGTCKALSENKIDNIACLEKGDLANDFVIKWHDLSDIDELSVVIGMAEKTAPNIITMVQKDEKIIPIKNSGSYTIPKSEYKGRKSTINDITFKFRTTKNGMLNPKLVEDSSISITESLEKRVPFE